MKITCPTNKYEEIEELIQNGANEFYMGYVPKTWKRKLSHIASSNRRYYPESNFSSMQDIKKAVLVADKYDVPINLAMNGSYYQKNQYPIILKQIKQAQKAGINSIIVTDIPLMLKIKKLFPNLGLIISTCSSTFNSSSINFYESLEAKRVVLPRHLTVPEIKTIRSKVNVELELLGLFDWCIYDDGMCTFHHGMEKILGVDHGCLFVNEYKLQKNGYLYNPSYNKNRIIDNRITNLKYDHFCAACLATEFKEIGINFFKIAGRRLPTSSKVQALKFIIGSMKTTNHEQLYFDTFQRRHPLNANAYE
jgi:U32 family peptidase